MTNFMYDFLPSFYKDSLTDANGNSILDSLFEIYTNCMGDALSQSQQLSMVPYLEQTPIVIKEYFKTIDIRSSNKYGTNQFIIDNNIIGFDTICYDANLESKIPLTWSINYDNVNNIMYIQFSDSFDPRINTLYAKLCYRHENLLRDTFGKLLNYQPTLPFLQYGLAFINQQETYRKQLLALLYCSINGQTIKVIRQSLGIFLGLQYAPFNAIVRDNSGTSITLEDVQTGNLQTINGSILSSLTVGLTINKYDVLENASFYLYDMYSDPARFAQYIIANNSENLLALLNIDTTNNEQYANLTYDSLVAYDDTDIYWDMGNNTGISHAIPGGIVTPTYPQFGLVNNFSTYNDSRFESQKIYEMFRNVFIVEFLTHQSDFTNINYFLNRFKPIYTKYLLYNPS